MLCAQTLSLVLSLNRGTWIALAWGLSVSAVVHRKSINLKVFFATGLLLAICFGSLMLSRFEELNKEGPAGYSQNTFEGRLRGGSDTLSMIAKRPLIGHGLDTVGIVTKRKWQTELFPHNDFLRLAFEAGVFATLAYACFLVLLALFLYAGTGRKQSTYVSFPAFAAICYFITISTVQNIVFSQVLFPLALTFFAAAKALGEIEAAQTGLPLPAGTERKTAAERPLNCLPADA
ncbi:MAG: O-antigen ligase family protein [Desulfobacteraceae bacterium]|nr:O-antigen ligase family protein [Desulfobacteraceae bacterium]